MLARIKEIQDQFLSNISSIPSNEKLPAFLQFMNALKSFVIIGEKQYSREELIAPLSELREILRQGPLFRLSQDWSKGYQGDFEIIKYILNNNNECPPDSLAYFGEQILLNSPVCQQHRNKIKRQAELIEDAIIANPFAKIVSVGCGISDDIYSCLDIIRQSEAEIILIDVDAEALQYSAERLKPIEDKVTILQGNIYRSLIQLKERYDLIMFGGVFDYLSDQVSSSILSRLSQQLTNEGNIFFTNIKKGNPYRIYLEYLSNWVLIERSQENLHLLLDNLRAGEIDYEIELDSSGMTYLVLLGHNVAQAKKESNEQYALADD